MHKALCVYDLVGLAKTIQYNELYTAVHTVVHYTYHTNMQSFPYRVIVFLHAIQCIVYT
jgi:hypothetical protein